MHFKIKIFQIQRQCFNHPLKSQNLLSKQTQSPFEANNLRQSRVGQTFQDIIVGIVSKETGAASVGN